VPFRRRHHRRWIALIALFGLLFQQLAMAAYVCPLEGGDGVVSAALQSTTPPCHAPDGTDKARCEQHCHPTTSSLDHASTPSVPPAMLSPAQWLADPAQQSDGSRRGTFERSLVARVTAPSLNIQHCTFQI
jgi:hypothetical protein